VCSTFEHICHANGINPVVGEEFYVADKDHTVQEKNRYGGKYYHLILLCENAEGYKNMSWLSSRAFTEGLYYGKPRIDFEMLKQYHKGIICLSACIQGELPQMLLHGDDAEAEKLVKQYSELFGPDHYYIELQDHGIPEQKLVAPKLIAIATKTDISPWYSRTMCTTATRKMQKRRTFSAASDSKSCSTNRIRRWAKDVPNGTSRASRKWRSCSRIILK
jgi:DNA polymerase III alpha subunit